MSLDLRLRAYAPNGATLGILPTPDKFDASAVLGDVGALSMDYPREGPRAALLANPGEVALEVTYDGGQTWTEPNDMRFLRLRRSSDDVAVVQSGTYAGPGYVWRLSKARVLPEGQLNADGKRAFLSATPGTILRTLTQEAQARGALAGMDFTTFTAATDSAGLAWPKEVTLYYEPGLDLLTILGNLQEQGLVDFTMSGRSLRLYVADTVMAGDSGAVLQRGRDLTEAPYQATLEGLADYAYLAGDDGVFLERTNAGALAPWGRWETYISQGGVSDPGTMATLTDASLALASDERVENTYGLVFADTDVLPFRDYALGRQVGVRTGTAAPVSMRLRSITLGRDEAGAVTGNVVLNDRFLENEVRQSRRIQGITGGSTADGGSGARPSDGVDRTIPEAPTGVTATSDAYLDGAGRVFATIQVNWTASTTNTDGTAMTDRAGYEVAWRLTGDPTWTVTPLTDASATSLDLSGFEPNTHYEVSVRAVDETLHRSAWAALYDVITSADAAAPGKPSAPVVAVYLGQLLITWDGRTATGGTMPADFARLEVRIGTAAVYSDATTTLVDAITSPDGGSTVATDLTYDTTYYVWLKAFDSSGNASPASDSGSGVPLRAADGDISDMTVNKITAGALSASITVSGRIATSLTVPRVEMISTGIKAYNGAGALTVDISASGSATFSGTLRTAPSGARTEIIQGASSQGIGQSVMRQYSGIAGEVYPTELVTGVDGTGSTANAWVRLLPPTKAVGGATTSRASLTLFSKDNDTGADVEFQVLNGSVYWYSDSPYGVHYFRNTGSAVAWATLDRSGVTWDTNLQVFFIGLDAYLKGPQAAGGTVNVHGQDAIILTRTGASNQWLGIRSDGSWLVTGNNYVRSTTDGLVLGGPLDHVSSATGHYLSLTDQFGQTRLYGSTDGTGSYIKSTVLYNRTATFTANVGIATAPIGVLYRITSSRRYKRAIQAQAIPLNELRDLAPKSYVDLSQYEDNGNSTDGLPRYLGLMAEDVAELPTLGSLLVPRNDQGEPESVAYDRLAVALLAWLKDHDARLEALERPGAAGGRR